MHCKQETHIITMTKFAKLSIVALLVNISLGYAKEKKSSIEEIKEVSTEISTYLNNEAEDFKFEGNIKVFFSVDADSKINNVGVISSDENTIEFIKTNLLGKKINTTTEAGTDNTYSFTIKTN